MKKALPLTLTLLALVFCVESPAATSRRYSDGLLYTNAANWKPIAPSSNRVEHTFNDDLSFTVTNAFDQRTNSLRISWFYMSNVVTHAEVLTGIGVEWSWICPTGYSTFHTPIILTAQRTKGFGTNNYAVTNMFGNIGNPMAFYTFLQASNQFVLATAYTNGTWTDPNFQLSPHRPLFVGNFSGAPLTNFFSGVIRTGDYTNHIVPGNNYLCSQIFKDGCIMEQDPNGTITQRGMAIAVSDNNDTVKVYHDGAWRESEYVDEEWSAISGYYVQVNLGPKIQIGQCFMYHNGTAATNIWIQGAHY